MAGLVPFNRRGNLTRTGSGIGFENFYNMLDDYFGDGVLSGRNLLRDTFKVDIEETEKEFILEAEMPGIKKEEIDLGVEDDNLAISINRVEEAAKDGKNYIHRERRQTSMSRRIRLADADLSDIKAKLEEGVLTVNIPKKDKSAQQRKIAIE